jgi:divalent metal cation (Fe/Co/Zn/Cd) transporter
MAKWVSILLGCRTLTFELVGGIATNSIALPADTNLAGTTTLAGTVKFPFFILSN